MKLIRLKPLGDCKLHLWYDDGVDGVVDLTPKHEQSVFTKLRDDTFLAKAKIDECGSAIVRNKNVDADARSCYIKITGHNPFISSPVSCHK